MRGCVRALLFFCANIIVLTNTVNEIPHETKRTRSDKGPTHLPTEKGSEWLSLLG